MLPKILCLQIVCSFFLFSHSLQAQNDVCSQRLARISKILNNTPKENSATVRDSLKLANLLLNSMKIDCPRKWELLSAHFKIGELYEKIGLSNKAIPHYQKIVKIEEPMKWEIEYTFNKVAILKYDACKQLAELYLKQEKFNKANDYALRYLMARRKVLTCGHSFRQWRSELLHLQLSIAFAQEDYEDAHLLMRRFTNSYGAIGINDEKLFPFFQKLVIVYYSESEREALRKEAVKSLDKTGAGLVAKYGLIRISVWNEEIRERNIRYQKGDLQLKYLQNAAKRVLAEVLSEKNIGL